jgi:hypothetical protein
VPPVTDPERAAIPPPNVKPETPGVLGIEPDFGGALALCRGPGDWAIFDAPTTGKGKQRELDAATLAAWLRELRPVRAFVEDAAALPNQGMSSIFRHRGMFWGLKAALAAFAVSRSRRRSGNWRPGLRQGPTRNTHGRWRCGAGRTKPSTSVASVTAAGPRQC